MRIRADVGKQIEEVRSKLGVTKGEFARRLGKPGQGPQIGKYESGKVPPSPETLRQIATLAKIPVSVFYEQEENAGQPITLQEAVELRALLDPAVINLQEAAARLDRAVRGAAGGEQERADRRVLRRIPVTEQFSIELVAEGGELEAREDQNLRRGAESDGPHGGSARGAADEVLGDIISLLDRYRAGEGSTRPIAGKERLSRAEVEAEASHPSGAAPDRAAEGTPPSEAGGGPRI